MQVMGRLKNPGAGPYPVTQADAYITLDLGNPEKPQLIRRFVDADGHSRFQFVGRNNFLCADEMCDCVSSGDVPICQIFKTVVDLHDGGTKNGIELFGLRALNGGCLRLGPKRRMPPFGTRILGPEIHHYSNNFETMKDCSLFYLIDEPKDFVIAQLFKSVFNTINSKGDVEQSIIFDRNE